MQIVGYCGGVYRVEPRHQRHVYDWNTYEVQITSNWKILVRIHNIFAFENSQTGVLKSGTSKKITTCNNNTHTCIHMPIQSIF